MTEYFSVPTFVVLFRETLEASVIISVLLQFLEKSNAKHLRRAVWAGAILGLILSIGIGVIFIVAFYVAQEMWFTETVEKLVEGIFMLLACAMITAIALSISRILGWTHKFTDKLSHSAEMVLHDDSNASRKLFWLSLSSVLKEGLESVLLIVGVTGATTSNSIQSLPIAGIAGVLVGIGVGIALYYGGGLLKLRLFFISTSVFLLFVGAGLCAHGIHEFQELGAFGVWKPTADRSWHNQKLWDWTECCGHDNIFFGSMRAIFGYSAKSTFVELMAYIIYWLLIGVVFGLLRWHTHHNDTGVDSRSGGALKSTKTETDCLEELPLKDLIVVDSGKTIKQSSVNNFTKTDDELPDSHMV